MRVHPSQPQPLRAARVAAVLAGATALLILVAQPALAHTRLRSSAPSASATVTTTPREVRLRFTEVVEPGQSQVLLDGPDGESVRGVRASRDPEDATVLRAALPSRLPRGTYTVRWRVLSVDGHPVAASFRFAVGRPSSPLAVTSASGLGPTVAGGAGRALDDVGLLALVGLTAFPLLLHARRHGAAGVSVHVRAAVWLRLRPLLIGAALVGGIGNVLLAVDTVAQSRGFPVSEVGAHLSALRHFLLGSRSGRLLVVRESGLLLLAALVLSSASCRRLSGRAAHVGYAATAAAILGTVSLASHAGTAVADTRLSVAVDWSHLLAAGVWTGGLLALAQAGLPVVRSVARSDPEGAADQAGALTTAFSDAAQVCMLVVFVTGTYEALVHVSGVAELGVTAWGGELTAKLALWSTVLLVAAASTVWLVPRISRRVAGASARLVACGELASAMRFELAVAAALITIAAVLAGTAPPDQLT